MNIKYGKNYFEETSENLLLKNQRPLFSRWVKIIKRYKPSGKLLDVGCGLGFFLESAEKYYDAHGIDISEYSIREARKRTKRSKLSIGNATNLNYENEFFDVITAFDLLEHISSPIKALKDFHRVLKPNGIIIVRVPNVSSIGEKIKKDGWFGYTDKTHISLLSNNDWLNLTKKTDFEILDIFYDGLWDTPYFKFIPKILQDVFIKVPTLILFLLGVRFPKPYGENLCIIMRRK